MTTLLHPGPGEMVDRMTILTLKIVAGRGKNIPVGRWELEKEDLRVMLSSIPRSDSFPLSDYDAHWSALAKINKRLWDAEDEVRVLPDPSAEFTENTPENLMRLAELAKLIPHLNDQRARLVADINGLFGIESMPKLYNNS